MYGDLAVVDYFGKLSKLKQKSRTIDEYIQQFMHLSHQVQGLSKKFLTSCFVSGLRNNARVETMAKRPNSVLEAISLARLEEEKELMIKKPHKHSYSKNGSSSTSAIVYRLQTRMQVTLHPLLL